MGTRGNVGRGRRILSFIFSFLLLIQENVTEETYIHLDKQLFELFLTLSQCLGSVEELLQTPGLCREDVGAQQVFYEVGNFQMPMCWPLLLSTHEVIRSCSPLHSGLTHCVFLPLHFADTGSRAEKTVLSSE